MSVPEKWWQTSPDIKETKARWLGLFYRKAPLQEFPPKRLSIPVVKEWKPQKMAVQGSIHNTISLSIKSNIEQPMNLFTQTSKSIEVRGTVNIASILDEQSAESTMKNASHEDRLWEIIKIQAPASTIPKELSLARRLAYLLQSPIKHLLSKDGPLEWHKNLFPYQLDGVQALLYKECLLLADDMGLGKTVQAIAALRILIWQRRIVNVLIIVPASLISQWRREIRTWAPELRISTVLGPAEERAYQWSAEAHIFLTSYETLRSDFTTNPQSPPRRHIWDVVILDEAQKIKNRETEVSHKCKQIPRLRAWVLTGTPLENREDDLVSILEFLTPLGQDEKPKTLTPGPELWVKHKNLQLRRKKHEVLPQLPPKIINNIMLPLNSSQLETYERAEKQGIIQLKEKGELVRVENVLELILRLKQICNFCPRTGQSSKLDDIKERLQTLSSEGHKALIFSQFTDDKYGVSSIVNQLKPFYPLSYTGALPAYQKEAVIRAFKSDPLSKVLILSLRAGGQGLNLQEASYVFLFDRWWNPAVEHQAEDRSHRLGQLAPQVNIYKYICENTIEERIEVILVRKQQLFEEIVDDVSLDLKAILTAEEIFGLFGLTPPKNIKTKRERTESYVNLFDKSSKELPTVMAGIRVYHPSYGNGTIISCKNIYKILEVTEVTIRFGSNIGIKIFHTWPGLGYLKEM